MTGTGTRKGDDKNGEVGHLFDRLLDCMLNVPGDRRDDAASPAPSNQPAQSSRI